MDKRGKGENIHCTWGKNIIFEKKGAGQKISYLGKYNTPLIVMHKSFAKKELKKHFKNVQELLHLVQISDFREADGAVPLLVHVTIVPLLLPSLL